MSESETEGMKRIRKSEYVLNFMTHEARNMMEVLQYFDLRVYDQVKLMEIGYNYNPQTVIKVLNIKPSKKSNREHDDGSFPVPKEDYSSNRDKIENFHKTPKMVERRHVALKPPVIDNLMLIDQHILYADYNTPLEAIINILSDPLVTEDMILSLASNGRNNMGLTIFKLQEMVESKRREDQELAKSFEPPEVEIGKPMSNKSVEAFVVLNEELKELMKTKKAYDGLD